MRQILDGKRAAEEVKSYIRERIYEWNLAPRLTVVQVGNDPASNVYVRNKEEACKEVGIAFRHIAVAGTIDADSLHEILKKAAANCDGIILQLPLPKHLNPKEFLKDIPALKDVDGFSKFSIFTPCTPLGVMNLLEMYQIPLAGKHAVVIGRSDIVGRPMAKLLLDRDCTVTVCHSKTPCLKYFTQSADIIVSAVGKAKLITPDMVLPNSVIIDVGMNRVDGKLCGDVDPAVMEYGSGWITPVPGGVGPMTVAGLLLNTMYASQSHWREV